MAARDNQRKKVSNRARRIQAEREASWRRVLEEKEARVRTVMERRAVVAEHDRQRRLREQAALLSARDLGATMTRRVLRNHLNHPPIGGGGGGQPNLLSHHIEQLEESWLESVRETNLKRESKPVGEPTRRQRRESRMLSFAGALGIRRRSSSTRDMAPSPRALIGLKMP